MKRAAAFTFFAAFSALLILLALQKPVAQAPGESAAKANGTSRPFHELERKGLPDPAPDPACAGCHSGPPHVTDRRTRAFLNQHAAFMSCLGCHTNGAGVTLSRKEEDGRVTATVGGAPAKAPNVSGKAHLLSGTGFVARPGDCRSCHSRASNFFKVNRFYNEYRQRLLEDLDVLAIMENAG